MSRILPTAFLPAAAVLFLVFTSAFAVLVPASITEAQAPNAQQPGGELKILPPPGPARGAPMPEFSWTALDGSVVTPESLAGKVVLLDFWASWCVPCQRAIPHLKELDRRYPEEVFQIVGVNVDEKLKSLQGWIATYGIAWPQVWDEGYKIVQPLQIRDMPTYILLDPQGRVAYSTSGYNPTTKKLLDYHVSNAVQRAQASK